ncbi:GlxA family transcriptional regulator [Paraburkholderia acidisoli]|uniref:Helix-turn-helix domain-containing protein n=1 Tax=Paraburkholderia acidisoli TaxID=2571748 RepID=A0A7Z2GNP5_9BURK|nr:GlxA family transcriptional regulator [Paraburkholderia acidisoli]QGZ65083.1 helix-turn-helix domain-containing protein [Paraburkholderia acidisoli]
MRSVSVGIVLFPGFQLLDVAGPKDAFAEVDMLSKGGSRYEIVTVGTTHGSIRSSSGLAVTPERTIFDPCPHFDTVIVPGGLGIFPLLEDKAFCAWLVARRAASRRLAAVCNGAFAFGAAGLLEDRTVTTHWMDAPRLAAMFPRTTVQRDKIFVKDEGLYTTAGVSAGVDLAIAMIEEDFGRSVALAVAKYLIVYVQRSGDQSQFSPLLEAPTAAESPMHRLQTYMLENLTENHTMESLADEANMSARNLSRVFARECGVSVMAYLADARIDAARQLLEATDAPLTEVARRCGFDGSEALRQAFNRRLKISPLEYRSRFQSSEPVAGTPG